ncbi:DeoR/GlpR family DNA-binding transcription regulator [Georgenia faecalis]|uniref:DeoR/GlpR family DNA-binding transcription regulator n=1 Tax=Georgenia faecalis TaxID=2483799 RepID=A0ABV9D6F7_9MICO|nr:DeoR/GlpR family DNA-binding transcription regulator [Georgenia faecalis]
MTPDAPAAAGHDGPPLLARQRQNHILATVSQHGGVRVADMVDQLGVSEMTVRRDITSLVRRGLVARVHGGAVSPTRSAQEPRFATKSTQHQGEKARIGAYAAARVHEGDSLALSAGTTTLAVARALTRLPHFGSLTVITNSLPAADVLHAGVEQAREAGRSAPTVVLTGGERTRSDALVGPATVDYLRDIRVEWVFLGAHGFDPTIGLMTPNLQEAETNAALLRTGRSAVAVLDSTKWGVRGLRTFCRVEDLAALVTDAEPDDATRAAADTHDFTLEVAQ